MTVRPSVAVAVVAVTSARCLANCLDALLNQEEAPPFEIVVAYDPQIAGVQELRDHYPDVRMLSDPLLRAPVELAARAMRESEADLILLTEDHCVPKSNWVRQLHHAQREELGAVGGVITCPSKASATDWAYYFTDYLRYVPPVSDGPHPGLTICNISYLRNHLAAIDVLGATRFEETAANTTLRERFGPLWLVSGAEVTTHRRVRLRDALREREAFGRQFACDRIRSAPTSRSVVYSLAALALPPLMLVRLSGKALRSPSLRSRFLTAFPHILLLVLAWSLGEWLGYLTRREPSSLTVAPNIGD